MKYKQQSSERNGSQSMPLCDRVASVFTSWTIAGIQLDDINRS